MNVTDVRNLASNPATLNWAQLIKSTVMVVIHLTSLDKQKRLESKLQE